MAKLFKDMHTETSGGKYSSKKLWGSVIMILISLSFIGDGFHLYETDHTLFNSMLMAGTALLGLNTIGGIFKKPELPTKK